MARLERRNPNNVPLRLSARDEQALRYGRGGQADDTRWLPEAAAGAMQAAGTDRLFRIALGAVAKALGRVAPVFRSSPAGQGGVHVPRAAAAEADREALALYDRLLDGRKFAELPRDAQLDVMRRTGWQELPTGETVKQLPRFEFGPGWTRYEPYATETRAVLSGVAENGVESIPPMTMSEAFAGKGADEFFGYYPNARRWLVRAGAAPAERVMGFSEPGSTAVTVTDEGLMRGAEPVLNTAHHETQHVVQNMSGMSPGSTSADALAELKAGVGNALLDGRGSDPAVIRAVDSLQQAIKSSDPAYHAYQHAGGEAGAFAAGNAAVEGRAGELITDAMSREGIAPENVYDLRALRQDNKGGDSGVASRNAVLNTVSRETPQAKALQKRRERDTYMERVAAYEPPYMSARNPRNEPLPTREQYREIVDARGGQGNPDKMMGDANPLVMAPLMAAGLPETAAATLAAAGLTVATMKGIELLSESHPRLAKLANLGLMAAAIPGLAANAKSAFVKTLNDIVSEPTEAKVKLLYEMVKSTSETAVPASDQKARVAEGLRRLFEPNERPRERPTNRPGARQTEWDDLSHARPVAASPAGRAGQTPASQTPSGQVRPMPSARPNLDTVAPGVAPERFAPEKAKGSRWYADLVERYGEDRANAMVDFVGHPAFSNYFFPDADSAAQIQKFADARKIIRDVTEPGEIVVGGSLGINLDGTIVRDTAVPHDLDFSGYIANASRRTDIPFFQKDGQPLSQLARDEMYAALSDRYNIENAPLIHKLRGLYPELRDAPFRYAKYDWEYGGGTQYEPGVFTVVKKPDITEAGNGNVLVTTMLNGNKVDLMLTDAKIRPSAADPRYGSAATAFDWKNYYGYRPKDMKDFADFVEFSRGNPVASAVSGRARFSPSRFADTLVTDEGYPVIADIEQYPGGPKIPMAMNHRGVMLQADDPNVLTLYSADNPINSPGLSEPASMADKPLVAARVTNQVARENGAPGEAGPSIGVYRADDLPRLARFLRGRAGGYDDIVVYRDGSTVDPQANLDNVLYTRNASTGSPHDPYYWPVRQGHGQEAEEADYFIRKELIQRAQTDPTPENLQNLARTFGETTRGAEDRVESIDNRLRNMLYSRDFRSYAEAKPGRYVPDSEARIFRSSDGYKGLEEALRDSMFAVPFMPVTLSVFDDEPEPPQEDRKAEVRQDANGGNARGKYPGSLNNPGNVEKRRTRRAGEVDSPHDRWAKFDTPQNGLAASAAVVREIAESKLAMENKPFTIRNYAEKYAPRSENDTDAYIRNLSKYSGIGADDVLDLWDTDAMSRLLRAKVRFESGVPHSQWFTDDEYAAAAEAMKEGAID